MTSWAIRSERNAVLATGRLATHLLTVERLEVADSPFAMEAMRRKSGRGDRQSSCSIGLSWTPGNNLPVARGYPVPGRRGWAVRIGAARPGILVREGAARPDSRRGPRQRSANRLPVRRFQGERESAAARRPGWWRARPLRHCPRHPARHCPWHPTRHPTRHSAYPHHCGPVGMISYLTAGARRRPRPPRWPICRAPLRSLPPNRSSRSACYPFLVNHGEAVMDRVRGWRSVFLGLRAAIASKP